jgi:hypothetical protein
MKTTLRTSLPEADLFPVIPNQALRGLHLLTVLTPLVVPPDALGLWTTMSKQT